MKNVNLFFLCLVFMLSSNVSVARDQYVIWLGGMKGAQDDAHQNKAAVDRVAIMIKSLAEGGVPLEDIVVHVSAGPETVVTQPKRGIGGAWVGTSFDGVLIKNENHGQLGSLVDYLKKQGIVIPPVNLRKGTFKQVEQSVAQAGVNISKDKTGSLHVYVTAGKEEGYFGRSGLDESPKPNKSIFAMENMDKSNYNRDYVLPQIERNQQLESILGQANENEKLRALLRSPDKIASEDKAREIISKMGLTALFQALPNNLDALTELRELFKMHPEARRQLMAKKIEDLQAGSKDMGRFKLRKEYGPEDFAKLIQEFRKNNQNAAVKISTDLDATMIVSNFANVCEYNSPLISDADGNKVTEVFAKALASGGSLKDVVAKTEAFKESSKGRKYGREGSTSIHNFLERLYDDKYFKSSGKGKTVFITEDARNCGDCSQMGGAPLDVKKQFEPLIYDENRALLMVEVYKYLQLTPEKLKNYPDDYLTLISQMTDAELKDLENLLSCFDPDWKKGREIASK